MVERQYPTNEVEHSDAPKALAAGCSLVNFSINLDLTVDRLLAYPTILTVLNFSYNINEST